MSQSVGSFVGAVRRRFWLAAGLSWLIGLFGWWWFRDSTLSLIGILLAGSGTAMAGLSAIRTASQPLEQTAQAVAHVASEAAGQPPPEPSTEVAKQLAGQVYQAASTPAKTLTSNIETDRSRLQALLDLMPVGLFAFDQEQKLLLINTVGEQLMGTRPGELTGLARPQVLDWLFQTDQTYDVWLEQARGKVRDQNLWDRVSLITKQNERKIGDVVAHYEKSESNGLETVVIFIDRTAEYKADESELDFVAVAAHELRGPITVIRGYLDVFQDEMKSVFNVEQQGLLQKMAVSAEMLSLYVNNILNVARVDQQIMPLHIVEADWREVLKETYADLFLRAKSHGRILKLELPATLPTVAIDRISTVEVINNLVDNAIKYSSEGGAIEIKAEQHEGLVSTTVTDHGIGIPDAILGNLFKKFYRSHKSRTGVSGTGLGLYLSKAIIDAHGGNIWVKSQAGKGSTFGFDLPTYASVADTLKKGDNTPGSIKRSSHGWIKNHAMYRPAQTTQEESDDKPRA
jgi:signal transduction histidine kinase